MAGEYDREQIYAAMRAADAAGDADAVRALTAALQAGASREQILAQAQQNNLAVNESDLDANIASRDAGGQTSEFLPPTRTGMAATVLGDGTRSIPEQMGAGVGDIVQTVGDVVGLVGNPLNATINAALGTDLSTDLGSTARDLSGLPDNPNELYSTINRGAASAMMFGGGARSLASMVGNPTAQGTLATIGQTPIRDAAAGAAAGAGAYAAEDLGPVGQVGAALGAGALGFGLAGMLPGVRGATTQGATTAARQGAADLVAAGRENNVRVMTSDAIPPRSFVGRSIQAIGERIPYAGTGGPRVAQNQERIDAVRNLARDFGVDTGESMLEEVANDLTATRGAAISGLTRQKDAVIDGLPGVVQAPRAISAINRQIERLRGINEASFRPVIAQLESFRSNLASGKSLREIEENRRLLGDMFEDPNLASIRGAGQKAINSIYQPLRDDMAVFISRNGTPDQLQGWERANSQLATMAGELDAANFKNVLRNSETTPEAVERLLFSKRPSDVRRLVGNLSNEGRARAQSAVIARALRDAGGTAGEDALSPQRFATAVLDARKLGNSVGVVFEGADRARVDGLARLIQATQRASDAAAAPPTGVQNAMATNGFIAGSVFGAGAIPVAGAIGLAARAYESAPVRNMLIGLSRTDPGTPAEARMIQRIKAALVEQSSTNSPTVTQAANSNAMVSAAAGEGEQQ